MRRNNFEVGFKYISLLAEAKGEPSVGKCQLAESN